MLSKLQWVQQCEVWVILHPAYLEMKYLTVPIKELTIVIRVRPWKKMTPNEVKWLLNDANAEVKHQRPSDYDNEFTLYNIESRKQKLFKDHATPVANFRRNITAFSRVLKDLQ